MERRNFLRYVAGGTAACLLPRLGWAAARRAKPNIVLFLIDDMGYSDTGCYGHPVQKTPNIDRLAAEGMRFTDAYAASPVCSPTRASTLTGKYPARVGITDHGDKTLDDAEITIGQALKDAGYVTGYIGKWHLGDKRPGVFGFDVDISGCSLERKGSYFSPYRLPPLKDGPRGEYLTDRLTMEAERFIETNQHRPFFLYLSHYAVHLPVQPRPDLTAVYGTKRAGGYHAMVASADESVGRILGKLDTLGLTGNTIVLFTSDNGGYFHQSNAPLRAGKGSLYEGGIRVPFIARWTGIVEAGSVYREPVISTDLYPTMLTMAGQPLLPEQHMDGVSLAPLLSGEGKIDREALFWHFPHHHRRGGKSSNGGAIRKGRFKLVEFFGSGKIELYDSAEDIGETRDLAHRNPSLVESLRADLENWRRQVGAKIPTSADASKVGKQTRPRVEALE